MPDPPHTPDAAHSTHRLPGRRTILRACAALAMGGPMAGAGYAVGVEPHWVQVVERDLPVAELDDDMVGKSLALISDLHVGPIVDDEYLRRAMRQVADLKPDLVAITGDIITYRGNHEIERAGEVLAELGRPPLGAFATLGNHDYGRHQRSPDLADALTRELENRQIITLRNAYFDVKGLRLAGMDDLWSRRFLPQHVSPALRGGRSSLVLLHNPDGADEAGWSDYRGWILCGHTHGGQCRVPFGPAPILPVDNRRYIAGEVAGPGGRRLYINRGLGYIQRLRFNARPEITHFRLTRTHPPERA